MSYQPGNAHRFQPGNTFGCSTANKKGRVGRKRRTDEQQLAHVLDRGWPVKARVEVVRTLAGKAVDGDVKAAELLFSYAFGRPRQSVEHSGQVGFEYASSWADVEEECRRLGLDPEMARAEARRLIESAENAGVESEDEE